MYVCIYIYIYIYIHVCMYVCMYVCIYIFIYIYICMPRFAAGDHVLGAARGRRLRARGGELHGEPAVLFIFIIFMIIIHTCID